MTTTSDPAASPVVTLLQARRSVLTGGEDSIGVQEQRVEECRRVLDAAASALESSRAEAAEIEWVLALLVSGETSEEGGTE